MGSAYRNITITGVSGFLGSNLAQYLAEHGGYKIVGTDHPKADFSEVGRFCSKILPVDLVSDPISQIFANADVVVHTAAIFDFTFPESVTRAVNVDAVERFCKMALKVNLPLLIHISSTGVYGKPSKIPCDENTERKPRNKYERTKRDGEDIVMLYMKKGLRAVILRPTLMYGPGAKYGYAMLIGLFALAREKEKTKLPSVFDGPMTHSVHVIDVCSAIKFFIDMETIPSVKGGPIFNVADDTPLRHGDMLKTIAEGVGVKLIPVLPYFVARPLTLAISHSPFYDKLKESALRAWDELVRERNLVPALKPRLDKEWNDYFAGDYLYDTSKLKNLGFKARFSFEEGIKNTIEWYKNARWIP